MLLVTECFLHLHWGLSEPLSTEIKIRLFLNHVISNHSKRFYFFFLHDLSWVLPTVYLKAKAGRCLSLFSFIKHSNEKWCYLLLKCVFQAISSWGHTHTTRLSNWQNSAIYFVPIYENFSYHIHLCFFFNVWVVIWNKCFPWAHKSQLLCYPNVNWNEGQSNKTIKSHLSKQEYVTAGKSQ